LIRRFRGISVIAHQTAHYIPVLLLYVTAIILLVGAGAGEGDLLLAAVGVEALSDKLAAVVRVNTEQGKGEVLPQPVYRLTYPYLSLTPDRQAFRPAAGYIHRTQRVQVKSFGTLTAMSDQIYFQEARLVLLPISKGPDGY